MGQYQELDRTGYTGKRHAWSGMTYIVNGHDCFEKRLELPCKTENTYPHNPAILCLIPWKNFCTCALEDEMRMSIATKTGSTQLPSNREKNK